MTAESMSGTWRRVAGACLLLLAVWGVYGGMGRHGWVAWDDNGYIYENEWVKGGLTWEGVKWAWTTGEQANWHPLTWLSLMLDRDLFGDWAGGGHLETAALHGVNALLLWWVLGRLTGCWGMGWWVALLWAVHPLRVESVAWASERKDVLAVLFGLAAVVAYAGGRGGKTARRRDDESADGEGRGRMWCVAGWLAASLMCKPTMVTLPCVLLLLDGWPLGRWKKGAWWRLVGEKWGLWAVVVVSCGVTMVVQQEAMSGFESLGMGERVATALCGYGWYLEKLVWPTGLAFFYPRGWAGVTWAGAVAWGVVLLGTSAAAAWAWRWKGWGWAGVGWFWFLGTLVPMIGLVQVGAQAWADRYSYWPHVGLCLTAVWGAWTWAEKTAWRRHAACMAGAVSAGALILAARGQAETWKDNAHLFGRAFAVTTENATAEGNWGTELAKEGRWQEAEEHLEEAARLERGKGIWWYQLGTVRWNRGKRDGALDAWARAARVDSRQWEAMNNLAWACVEDGRVEEAREWMDRAMANDAARANAGVWDTEAAVRREAGDEEGAREAEVIRDKLRNIN